MGFMFCRHGLRFLKQLTGLAQRCIRHRWPPLTLAIHVQFQAQQFSCCCNLVDRRDTVTLGRRQDP